MKTLHVVRQGEYLRQIAFRHGVTVDDIWADPENANLHRERHERGEGHILEPGDVVVIPERRRSAPLQVRAGELRELVVSLPRTPVQLRLAEHDQPLANLPYRVEFAGRTVRGQTSGDGDVTFEVGLFVHHARLTLEAHEQAPERSYDLEIGGLDPLETITGQQQRLKQLGLFVGRVSGVLDEATRAAIEELVRSRNVEPARWLEALQDAYGC